MISLDKFTLPQVDPLERELLARGVPLEKVYPEEYQKESLDSVLLLPSLEIPNCLSKKVLQYIPLTGKASVRVDVYSSNAGNFNEENYYLKVSGRSFSEQVSLGLFDSHEEAPCQQDYIASLVSTLENKGYNAFAEGAIVNLKGYNNSFSKLEAMDKIFKVLHSSGQIPLMKDFLITNFPSSSYHPGQDKDLTNASSSAIAIQFNKKYNYLKRSLS
jgi:hypothetical protein